MATRDPCGIEPDTLTFALGSLADTLLHKLFRCPEVCGCYATWLERVASGSVADREHICLVQTRAEGGELTLCGRPKPWEFILQVMHSGFTTELVFGFQPRTGDMDAVWVVDFSGDQMLAARWAMELKRRAWPRPSLGVEPDAWPHDANAAPLTEAIH